MKISIVTPNFNGAAFLERTLLSVIRQREDGVDLEYIVVDGGSRDGSMEIINRFRNQIDHLICEPDAGPASAINKGLRRAQGEVVGWLNADDEYSPGALRRVCETMNRRPGIALCFGRCRIVNEEGREIRRFITGFKELWFPFSSRAAIQTINYISQPAMFFRRSALIQAGPLREDLKAAWDYELVLRLWRHGGAARAPGAPLADFRWHPQSISGQMFSRQFREEWEVAAADAGRLSPQALLHWFVRWGIVGSYRLMAVARGRTR